MLGGRQRQQQRRMVCSGAQPARAPAPAPRPMPQGTGAWGIVVCLLAFYNGAADLFIEIYGKASLTLAW